MRENLRATHDSTAESLPDQREGRSLTKVEMRTRPSGRATASGVSPIKRLPVSRKATHPRMTRVETAVLLVLLVAFSVIVFVGVSGATRSGQVAACGANANSLTSGLTALRTENSGPFPITSAAWERALLSRTQFVGGPFLNAWPKSTDYEMVLAGAGSAIDSGDAVRPASGDVLVIAASGKVYDATVHPSAACAAA
jgi:hypothetical protein